MPGIVNETFDRVVCINLDRRPDRWTACARRCAELDLKVRRFAAIEGPSDLPDGEHPYWGYRRAHVGCAMSHLAVMDETRRDGL